DFVIPDAQERVADQTKIRIEKSITQAHHRAVGDDRFQLFRNGVHSSLSKLEMMVCRYGAAHREILRPAEFVEYGRRQAVQRACTDSGSQIDRPVILAGDIVVDGIEVRRSYFGLGRPKPQFSAVQPSDI